MMLSEWGWYIVKTVGALSRRSGCWRDAQNKNKRGGTMEGRMECMDKRIAISGDMIQDLDGGWTYDRLRLSPAFFFFTKII